MCLHPDLKNSSAFIVERSEGAIVGARPYPL